MTKTARFCSGSEATCNFVGVGGADKKISSALYVENPIPSAYIALMRGRVASEDHVACYPTVRSIEAK